MRKGARLPEFPKPDPLKKVIPSNIRLEKGLWLKLDQIAKAENVSRSEVIKVFLEWAVTDWEQAKARKGR